MKRSPALTPLSHDHHQALFVAQKLRRTDADSAAEGQRAFLEFWKTHGRAHFRCEEEILLPAYADHGGAKEPLVSRVLLDHMLIRRRAQRLEQAAVPAEALHELGAQLADHVRLEERELFPLIEAALSQPELAEVAAALAKAEGGAEA